MYAKAHDKINSRSHKVITKLRTSKLCVRKRAVIFINTLITESHVTARLFC